MSFNKDEVNHGLKVHKYSKLTWNVVSPQIRTDSYFYVSLTRLELNDNYFDVGLNTETHQLFDIREGVFRTWDYPDDVHVVLTYELERDLSKIRRQVYGILDYVGDIGGLAGAVFSIFSTLVLLF